MDHVDHEEFLNKRIISESCPERRDSPRVYTIYRLVQVQYSDDVGLGRCRNISDSGAALQLTMAVKPNDEVKISFSPTVTLAGRIAWVNGVECGVNFSERISSRDLLSATSLETHADSARPPRLETELPASIALDGRVFKTVVNNISQSGMNISNVYNLTLGQKVKVMLHSGIEREGIVRWTKDNNAGLQLIMPLSVEDLGSIERLRQERSGISVRSDNS